MSKVLVERERRGGKNDRPGRAARNLEDLPRKESMKKSHKDRKSLNENLSPLKRYLHSQVGKKWDNVFSEISKNLNINSAVQKHVKDHVWDFVHKDVKIEGKKVFSKRKFWGTFYELFNEELYIHPETGLLKKYKIKKAKRVPHDEFATYLGYISQSKSKILIEGSKVYKVFDDSHIEGAVVKQVATAKHAEVDFNATSWRGKSYIQTFFTKFLGRIDLKNPYWKKYYDLYQKSLKKDVKKEKPKDVSPFQSGVVVEVSMDDGKTFVDGIINRVEYDEERPSAGRSYWITINGKNEFFFHGVRRYRIRLKQDPTNQEIHKGLLD